MIKFKDLLLESNDVIRVQQQIKRLIEKYMSTTDLKGGYIERAAPTIIRGTDGKTQRKITSAGDYKVYATKDAWNAVEIYFINRRNIPNDLESFIEPIENLLNTKFNLNFKWFDRKEFPRLIIRDSIIKAAL